MRFNPMTKSVVPLEEVESKTPGSADNRKRLAKSQQDAAASLTHRPAFRNDSRKREIVDSVSDVSVDRPRLNHTLSGNNGGVSRVVGKNNNSYDNHPGDLHNRQAFRSRDGKDNCALNRSLIVNYHARTISCDQPATPADRAARPDAIGVNDAIRLRTKRLIDIIFSTFGLLLCLPLFALIAVAIKRNSPGPVFFVHKRPGRGGRLFRIIKFRTMTLSASRQFWHLTPVQRREFSKYGKICTDPRVTPIGCWLRKFSLDELPQLWNVLRGDMSLVGPRPYLKSQLRDMGEARTTILQVKPGLTGIWQVSGRSEIQFPDRLQMDVDYANNWTLWLDLVILLRTPWVMITGRGAGCTT